MYNKAININGIEYPIAVNITGNGAPTSEVEAVIGMLYMDINSGNLYKCTALTASGCVWSLVYEEVVEYSPNLIDPAEFEYGKYLSGANVIENPDFVMTGYIKITGGKTCYINSSRVYRLAV